MAEQTNETQLKTRQAISDLCNILLRAINPNNSNHLCAIFIFVAANRHMYPVILQLRSVIFLQRILWRSLKKKFVKLFETEKLN